MFKKIKIGQYLQGFNRCRHGAIISKNEHSTLDNIICTLCVWCITLGQDVEAVEVFYWMV